MDVLSTLHCCRRNSFGHPRYFFPLPVSQSGAGNGQGIARSTPSPWANAEGVFDWKRAAIFCCHIVCGCVSRAFRRIPLEKSARDGHPLAGRTWSRRSIIRSLYSTVQGSNRVDCLHRSCDVVSQEDSHSDFTGGL